MGRPAKYPSEFRREALALVRALLLDKAISTVDPSYLTLPSSTRRATMTSTSESSVVPDPDAGST